MTTETPPSDHLLRVTGDGLRVECRSAGDADCRTTNGTCLVVEQAADLIPWQEYYNPRPAHNERTKWAALTDGTPITVTWTSDGVYEWTETTP
jgi:hypothetical protein